MWCITFHYFSMLNNLTDKCICKSLTCQFNWQIIPIIAIIILLQSEPLLLAAISWFSAFCTNEFWSICTTVRPCLGPDRILLLTVSVECVLLLPDERLLPKADCWPATFGSGASGWHRAVSSAIVNERPTEADDCFAPVCIPTTYNLNTF